MDHPRFDSLARVLARTSSPSRRAFLRLLLGGVAGGALTTPRPRSAAGQDDCKLGCPFGTTCVNGACEEIAITAPCPAGCPPGFVCSGERCVEELPAADTAGHQTRCAPSG